MGAALLTNPDTLCAILTALRESLPPHIPVSCKIRLLTSQEDTLALVARIIETGISALTVHCRTRSMRREPALIHRLREIVDFVAASGKNIAVIENGDCVGLRDAEQIKELTGKLIGFHAACTQEPHPGAHSVMIATAAENNPSCFSATPLVDVEETLIPSYIRMVCSPPPL
jgi:tRNA-dihydrouridine synthase 2